MKANKDVPPWCGRRAACWKPAHRIRSGVIQGERTIQGFRWH